MPEKLGSESESSEQKIDLGRRLIISEFEHGQYREDDNYAKLLEFEGDPNHIVRIEKLDIVKAQLGDENLATEDAVSKVKNLFDELKTKYNIEAPIELVTDEKGEEKLIYIITDKITGQDIEKIDFNSPDREKRIEETGRLFLSLVKYFVDKFNSNELVFWDIPHHSAFKFGKKGSDVSDRIYLVDTDLKLTKGKHGINDLTRILETIEKVELKCGKKFDDIRIELKNFIESIQMMIKRNIEFGSRVLMIF